VRLDSAVEGTSGFAAIVRDRIALATAVGDEVPRVDSVLRQPELHRRGHALYALSAVLAARRRPVAIELHLERASASDVCPTEVV
jgi:hypothetical protein